MRTAALVLLVTALLFAVDSKEKPKKEEKKAEAADRAKQADAWVAKFFKGSFPDSAPRWYEVFEALERKYGQGRVPCATFDAEREKYFEEFIRPWALKEKVSVEGAREDFTAKTDLPTVRTLTGRKRKGCLEK
jgi:hypothetical protein